MKHCKSKLFWKWLLYLFSFINYKRKYWLNKLHKEIVAEFQEYFREVLLRDCDRQFFFLQLLIYLNFLRPNQYLKTLFLTLFRMRKLFMIMETIDQYQNKRFYQREVHWYLIISTVAVYSESRNCQNWKIKITVLLLNLS